MVKRKKQEKAEGKDLDKKPSSDQMKRTSSKEKEVEKKPEKSGAALEEVAREELDELREKATERDEFLDKLKRARADYANYQKRVERDRESLGRFILQDFLNTLLPVLDNLQRAIESSKSSKEFEKFLEGVSLVERQFLKVLEESGVKPMNAKGEAFNPAYHEAAFQMENEEVPVNTILEEIEKGYLFREKVLRASKVIVSKKKETEGCAAGGEKKPKKGQSEECDGQEAIEEEMGSSSSTTCE